VISTQLVVLLLVVAALAFFAGYQLGRQSSGGLVSSQPGPGTNYGETGGNLPPPTAPASPLPMPRTPEPRTPRGAPPPASAGGGSAASGNSAQGTEPKRRSAPPPARAGLLDPGNDRTKT